MLLRPATPGWIADPNAKARIAIGLHLRLN
jgi:hypothetical protein